MNSLDQYTRDVASWSPHFNRATGVWMVKGGPYGTALLRAGDNCAADGMTFRSEDEAREMADLLNRVQARRMVRT